MKLIDHKRLATRELTLGEASDLVGARAECLPGNDASGFRVLVASGN